MSESLPRRDPRSGRGGVQGEPVLRMPRVVAFMLGGVVGVGLYSAMEPIRRPRDVYVDRVVFAFSAPVADAQSAPAMPVSAGATMTATAPVDEEARACASAFWTHGPASRYSPVVDSSIDSIP